MCATRLDSVQTLETVGVPGQSRTADQRFRKPALNAIRRINRSARARCTRPVYTPMRGRS